MKRIFFWAIALIPAVAQAQVADTLRIENPSSVQVISSPGSLSVSIDGTADKPHFHYSNSVKAASEVEEVSDRLNFETPFTRKKNLSHWKIALLGMEEVGLFEGVLGGEDLFGNWKTRENSADLGIISLRYYPGLKNHYLSLGWTVGYAMTEIQNNEQHLSQTSGMLSWVDYPAGASKLGTSTIRRLRYSLPLQYTFVFGKNLSWRASAGAELHWNLVNHTRTHYHLNGNHVIELVDNIKPNLATVDLMTSLTWKGFGVRFRYSPTPAFTAPHGPEYRTWSVGFLVEY